jgi:hypothetical protein
MHNDLKSAKKIKIANTNARKMIFMTPLYKINEL